MKPISLVNGKFEDKISVFDRGLAYGDGFFETMVWTKENKTQFWVPPGFAHGFVVISDTADFEYKCTDYYDPSDEGCILWNDPDLNISWPIENPKLSDKDSHAHNFIDIK